MTDWRPIETAPKDGTRVLLYQVDSPIGAHKIWIQYCNAKWGEYWLSSDESLRMEPSHWMPLPPPPKDGEG
jgi:hypothetical protein